MRSINFFEHETNVTVVPAGETIFKRGDPGDVMYGIKSGTVEISAGESIIRTLGAGEIFGEMAIIDREPRSATAVAKTECELVAIEPYDFIFRIQHHPTFAIFVMRTAVSRLRDQTG